MSEEKHATEDCVNAASQKVAPAMYMLPTVSRQIANANVLTMLMPAKKVKRALTEHAKVL